MGPVEALKFALSKEIEAIEVYTRLSIENPTLKDTFDFLVTEEQKHKKFFEQKIYELTR